MSIAPTSHMASTAGAGRQCQTCGIFYAMRVVPRLQQQDVPQHVAALPFGMVHTGQSSVCSECTVMPPHCEACWAMKRAVKDEWQ